MIRALLILSLAAVSACSSDTNPPAGAATTAPGPPASTDFPPLTLLTSVVPNPVPDETDGQQAARELATKYLGFAAFSSSGLIRQLTLEGFSEDDASYAVFVINVDWNDQALKRATKILGRSESPTRDVLIEQLLYEGFTLEQAEFAAFANGF